LRRWRFAAFSSASFTATHYLSAVTRDLPAMSRRSTPERIDVAHRAATRNRLIGERVTPETADAWIAAWETQAAHDGVQRGSAYWEAGWAWIAERRRSRVRP
jgi:hypothetical protein